MVDITINYILNFTSFYAEMRFRGKTRNVLITLLLLSIEIFTTWKQLHKNSNSYRKN